MTDAEFEALRKKDPFAIAAQWLADARAAEPVNPEAMTLATIAADGMPQARTVLLKSLSAGGFIFYTNTESRKGLALAHAPRAALLTYWRQLGRQMSAEGAARRLSAAETEPYFQSRPRDSRVGAWASAQSRPLAALADLRAAAAAADKAHPDPRLPPHWRGYCLSPTRLEFWQEGRHRLHRRVAFVRAGENADWRATLLQP